MLSCVIKGENEELDSNEISIRDLNKYFFEDAKAKYRAPYKKAI